MRTRKKDYQLTPIDLSKLNVPLEINHSPLDEWQKEVIAYNGNLAICSGRQVGKTAVMALKCALYALQHPKARVLISSGSERQANYIYEMVKLVFKQIGDVFDGNPTMRLSKLKNGSQIYCLPTGQTGDLIRGLTLDIWIPDEAAYINDAVWTAVTPMLWIAKQKGSGHIWALSTPAGKSGKFYDCFTNSEFRTWKVSSEDCERIPKSELESWKRNYSKLQYSQEVLGEFVDDISRFFSDELIDSCIGAVITTGQYLGVDVARYGGDENAFVTVREYDDKYAVVDIQTTQRKGIHETFAKIIDMDKDNHYSKILIDDAGVGGGLMDFLLEKLQSRVIGISNAQRSVTHDKTRKGRLMKEDIYSNAVMLMEQGSVTIPDHEDLLESLRSILYEYNEQGNIKIYGRYSHISEAFVRALWGAKRKGLNLWCSYTGDTQHA